ncbi:MAG: calcium/sodium antiporter [Planctomycetes bacterium]|nr:calcium/sodium antiporter [Planctomycetota bacterium]
MPEWYSQPPLLLAAFMVVVGFYMLIKGADKLVEGAINVAQKFHLSTAVIGATVVAFGTSLPELVVSTGANLKALSMDMLNDPSGPAAIAIGNIVGSNIFNVGAILGIAAMVSPLKLPRHMLRLEYPLMILALSMLVLFSLPNGAVASIERVEGMIFFVGLLLFTYFAVKNGKVDTSEVSEVAKHPQKTFSAIMKISIGILMLTAGGDISLNGAIALAESVGMSERVIGLTVMAMGTSLPELATSITAAKKGEQDIAVGNIIGSNIFNVFCIVGISSMILPLPVHPGTMSWDYWWMMSFSLVLFPFMLWKGQLKRIHGFLLFSALVIYVSLLIFFPELTGNGLSA